MIEPNQCCFRAGKSNINQIFSLPQIMEITNKNQGDIHHRFVNHKV